MFKAFVLVAAIFGIYFLCGWLGCTSLTTGLCMAAGGMVGLWKL